jgi:ferrochelatase
MKGLLLVNLGTPDAPDEDAVRRYLAEFLSDPRVLDINPVARWLLLRLFILPRRPAQSAAAYRKIWGERGSPLLYYSRDLAAAVGAALGPEWRVELGMRYGTPSIAEAVARLGRVDVAFPLYPQFADSSTGSSLEKIPDGARIVPPFYDDPGTIAAFAAVGRPFVDADHVLFSFHGLPERHMRKQHPQHCLATSDCCAAISQRNMNCYRAQCFATARALRGALGLAAEHTTVCFQSRLGRRPWISPYTDVVVPELAQRGLKRLAVFCPAFVADCLETLEEIGIRARASFLAAGGQELHLVPSLNATPVWVSAVKDLVLKAAHGGIRAGAG